MDNMENMDDVIRKLLEDQYTTPDLSEGLQLQQGLLGATPDNNNSSNNSAEQMLDSMQSKNQANTQNMLATGQQGIQTAMQASQNLQNQRQAEMNAAQQQASQALAKQQQAEQQGGALFGKLLKAYFTGGLG